MIVAKHIFFTDFIKGTVSRGQYLFEGLQNLIITLCLQLPGAVPPLRIAILCTMFDHP